MKKIFSILLVLFMFLSVNLEAATITVNPCNTSGSRQANVTVDVGYDSKYIKRDYYAKTNNYKQLTEVTASNIILQDVREVKSDGRYCNSMANVPGAGSAYGTDRGHAIADSLGGVSNAYNITPQGTSVNRSGGKQYQMEENIRTKLEQGHKITNFKYIISYANSKTQTPKNYSYYYYDNGTKVSGSFANNITLPAKPKAVTRYTSKNKLKYYYVDTNANKKQDKNEKTTKITATNKVSGKGKEVTIKSVGNEKDYDTCSKRKKALKANAVPISKYLNAKQYSYYRDTDKDGLVCE